MQQLVSNGLSRPVAVRVSFAFFKDFYRQCKHRRRNPRLLVQGYSFQ